MALMRTEVVEIWLVVGAICMQLSFLALCDPPGFINIDCGIESNISYVDTYTGLTYVSDDQYIHTGKNYVIADDYNTENVKYMYLNTLRSFPNNSRNCYTVKNMTKGSKYLVRASFYYGNYDDLQKYATFDLYFGVNFWTTVDGFDMFYEIIGVAQSNYIQVCLVNTGQGTPFISALEVRQLSTTLYANAHSQQFLKVVQRENMVLDTDYSFIRYPEDGHDRIWFGWTDFFSESSCRGISTNSSVTIKYFDVPSSVLQTAVVSTNASSPLDIHFYFLSINNRSATFYVVLHFAELQTIGSTDLRSFDIYFNGYYWDTVTPASLSQSYLEIKQVGWKGSTLSLESTPDSTLPPIINAYEIFEAIPVISSPTSDADVTGINSVKMSYKDIDKINWDGDPCVPLKLRWEGVSCTNDDINIPRITALDLSFSRLTGPIIGAFGSLTEIRKLNLSHNNLEGILPNSLDQLTAIESLDISSNIHLHGHLPSGLKKRLKDNSLKLNYDGTQIVIDDKATNDRKHLKIVIVTVVVPVAVLLIGGAMTSLCLLYKKKHKNAGFNPQTQTSNDQNEHNNDGDEEKRPQSSFDRRRFSFEELKLVTNNFSEQIGIGGFGKVFKGCLENGKEVAVKVQLGLSSQGVRQFLNEVQSLSIIHHKNLVSLIGYCDERNNIALIYEYMQKGNLQEWLRGNAGPLHWKQRLRIAYESAQGLEYLHKMCNPPLIHRDVKANNILLTTNLEAKISDFGLVRALAGTHTSTQVVGTPGYLDIYYASSSQLTEKSDVYSFGVVLLEMITGRSPILEGSQMGEHLTQFVHNKITRGNVDSILDPNIEGQFNMNSIWKIATLALRCTDEPTRRPDMTAVVTELKETLDLENCSTGTSHAGSADISQSTDHNHSRNENPSVGNVTNSDIEMVAQMKGLGVPDYGPSAR